MLIKTVKGEMVNFRRTQLLSVSFLLSSVLMRKNCAVLRSDSFLREKALLGRVLLSRVTNKSQKLLSLVEREDKMEVYPYT